MVVLISGMTLAAAEREGNNLKVFDFHQENEKGITGFWSCLSFCVAKRSKADLVASMPFPCPLGGVPNLSRGPAKTRLHWGGLHGGNVGSNHSVEYEGFVGPGFRVVT